MINFENVSKFVLEDISFHIPEGKIVGVIGVSGAGKTTLLKLVCGLLEPASGRIRTLGKEPISHRANYDCQLNVCMERLSLFDKSDTVRDGLECIRKVYRIPQKNFSKAYQELAARLGFAEFADEKVKNLSLGQRKRAEMGATLILAYASQMQDCSGVLLLDEPDVGLDANAKAMLREILIQLRKAGRTVLISSHDMSEISNLCDRIMVLHQGRLLYYGTERRLQRKYVPIDTMTVKLDGRLPDLGDLPFVQYTIESDILTLSYHSNYVTSAEILRVILQQSKVSEVKIRKPDLETIILQMGK